MINNKVKSALVLLLLSTSTSTYAASTDEILKQLEEIKAKVQVLEKKLAEQNKALKTAQEQAVNSNSNFKPSNNSDFERRLRLVERSTEENSQNVALAQRLIEVEQEKSANNAEKFGTVEYGYKGLVLTGANKNYSIKIGGYLQADARKYFADKVGNVDQGLIRSARPAIEVKLPNDFSAKLVTDFGNGNPRVVDALGSWKANDYLNISVGKLKNPLGLERQEKETETLFVERGLPTNLVPFRDIGILLNGDIIPQTLDYQIGLTNGVADAVDPNSDVSGGKDISGRLFAQPFASTDNFALQGLGLGFAASIGQRDGNTTNTELASNYKTTAQNNFFTYATGTYADGKNVRLNPQGWYYYGPFSILGEYVSSSNEVEKGASRKTLKNDAWTAIATYVLTGENASFDGVKPDADFSLKNGTWGAFELTARASRLNIDEKTFPTFASLTTAAKAVDEYVLGLNWYLSQNIKVNINYAQDKFEGGAAGGKDRQDERTLLSRVQFKF